MNLPNLRKWIAALRSGEFQQGKAYLNKGDKMCCLGVLCEVAIRNGVVMNVDRDTMFPEVLAYSDSITVPPPVVMDWLYGPNRLEHRIPKIEHPVMGSPTVIQLNDLHDWTFEQIADGLEKTYLAGVSDANVSASA